MEFSQVETSVFSLTKATPSDLVTTRNTARLIAENLKVKLNKSELPEKTAYNPLVVVGPSGVGKGTLINAMTAKYPNKFGFSVSCTTRGIREGEQNGVHYHFISVEKFKQMIENNEFIEHCDVHGNFYGTTKAEIERIQSEKKIPLLDIDVQGALKFEVCYPDANFMAILPTSKAVLEQRLKGRGTETEAAMQKRLGNANSEVDKLASRTRTFMYRVINDDLEVSKRTMDLLVTGLYVEELLGGNTAELIAATPRLDQVE